MLPRRQEIVEFGCLFEAVGQKWYCAALIGSCKSALFLTSAVEFSVGVDSDLVVHQMLTGDGMLLTEVIPIPTDDCCQSIGTSQHGTKHAIKLINEPATRPLDYHTLLLSLSLGASIQSRFSMKL